MNRDKQGKFLKGHSIRHRTHGRSRTPIYSAWSNMIQRVRTDPYYKNISVCRDWLTFEGFFKDMGKSYAKGLWLERIDNTGNYEKSNCRWTSHAEQQNNKRNNVFVEYEGKRQTLAQWAREKGIPYNRLRMRLKYGWKTERALVP